MACEADGLEPMSGPPRLPGTLPTCHPHHLHIQTSRGTGVSANPPQARSVGSFWTKSPNPPAALQGRVEQGGSQGAALGLRPTWFSQGRRMKGPSSGRPPTQRGSGVTSLKPPAGNVSQGHCAAHIQEVLGASPPTGVLPIGRRGHLTTGGSPRAMHRAGVLASGKLPGLLAPKTMWKFSTKLYTDSKWEQKYPPGGTVPQVPKIAGGCLSFSLLCTFVPFPALELVPSFLQSFSFTFNLHFPPRQIGN